jgi:hypothetical protein
VVATPHSLPGCPLAGTFQPVRLSESQPTQRRAPWLCDASWGRARTVIRPRHPAGGPSEQYPAVLISIINSVPNSMMQSEEQYRQYALDPIANSTNSTP